MKAALALWALVPTALATVYKTGFDNVTWDDSNWRLRTTYLDPGHYQSRANLANGYIGINLAALGPFFDVEKPVDGDVIGGWPLFNRRQSFATVSGFWDEQPTTEGTNYPWLYQLGGESVISGVPHWAGLVVESNGHILNASTDPRQISGFSSTFDYREATLSWRYSWTPPSSPTLQVEYSMFLHKLNINQAAVRLRLTSSRDARVTVADVLDGDCAVRSFALDKGGDKRAASIWSAVQPNNIPRVTAYVYSTLRGDSSVDMSSRKIAPEGAFAGSNSSSIAQQFNVRLRRGKTATIEKYIGIASSDAFRDPKSVARDASQQGAQRGYNRLFTSHSQEWKTLMPSDSVDDYRLSNGSIPLTTYAVEHQIQAVTNPFYMLQNTIGTRAIAAAGNNRKLHQNSISVCGLSSDCYAGMIFWDADVFMAPGLVLAFPEAAQQVPDYRVSRYAQAMKNTQENFISSQADKTFSKDGAIYSWTSARFGNCTATGPCFDYEYHLNGDIALQMRNELIVTGNRADFQSRMFPVFDSIALTYSELLDYNTTLRAWTLTNATDPDEFANHVDNPAFTMALIKTHLERANEYRSEFGLQPVAKWRDQAAKVLIPVDKAANIYLEYTGMDGSIEVKQADVVLIDHLLDYENPYTLSNLDYYAGKQSLNGPAMTFGVFSIVASHASPSGCSAFTYDVYGSEPYARAPWFQYSEQLVDAFSVTGFHPSFPFLTGMGGANQVATSGYLGLRLRPDSLNVDPTLPPQIPALRYRTFFWQGVAISASSNATHTTMKRLPQSRALATANAAWTSRGIPVTIGFTNKKYTLPASGAPLVIPNRQPARNLTVPGNAAQCHYAYSPQPHAPGQFAFAAVDGAVSTSWQPQDASQPAVLLVDLGFEAAPRVAARYQFDWAQAPPRRITVAFTNNTAQASAFAESGGRTVGNDVVVTVRNRRIDVSNPYDPAAAKLVRPYMSNSTTVEVSGRRNVMGRYALLAVQGTHNGGGATGSSVAEWAIVRAGASDPGHY